MPILKSVLPAPWLWLIIVFNAFRVDAAPNDTLMLAEAEQLAVRGDPAVLALQARADALDQRAVADGQLPDPRLKLAAMNLPTDSFDRDDVPMTQLQIGVQQAFPRGRSLHYRSEQTRALARGDRAGAENQRLLVLRNVRSDFLELYYQIQAAAILGEHEKLFALLVQITQRQYAAGRDNQHDVMRAQLELSLIADRLTRLRGDREKAVANLAKWLGMDNARRPLPESFPEMTEVVELELLLDGLQRHPRMRIEDAEVAASKSAVAVAEQQYKPGWMIDVSYGERSGFELDGRDRSDFLSAMLLIDLPLFRDKRQDRSLAASQYQRTAHQHDRIDRLRELQRLVETEYAQWRREGERLELYQRRTLLEAQQNSEATLKAYQSDVADFTTLMRARLAELDTRLAMLRIRVDRASAQARLLYLAGESP